MHHRRPAAALALVLVLAAAPATAQNDPKPGSQAPGQPGQAVLPAAPENRSSTGGGGETGVLPEEQASKPLFERSTFLPDPGGVRTSLAAHGLTIGLSEIDEALGNPVGGVRRGVIYEGLAQVGLGLDTGRAGWWQGGTVNVSALQIHGRGLSLNDLGNNLNTVSSIEAYRGTLLFELWYEQALFANKLQIRVGQYSADTEFQTSQYAGLFLNHTFGWSTQPSSDLPSGGPSYPLATPGVRLRGFPRNDLTLLAAITDGNPAGPGPGVPQGRDPSGTAFRLNDGVFIIAEAQYALNQAEGATGLPGTYKVGAWYDTSNFADQRRDASGRSLGGLTTATLGRNRNGDYSLYAIADQLVWRKPGQADGGVGVFARAMGAPGDRNLVNFYADAGVTWKGALPSRGSDTVGLGFGYARISDTAAKLDSDITLATGNAAYPIRRNESVLELTYQAQIAPWWQIQPTAQYIFNINGAVPDPLSPGKRLPDAAVFGLRSQITF